MKQALRSFHRWVNWFFRCVRSAAILLLVISIPAMALLLGVGAHVEGGWWAVGGYAACVLLVIAYILGAEPQ